MAGAVIVPDSGLGASLDPVELVQWMQQHLTPTAAVLESIMLAASACI